MNDDQVWRLSLQFLTCRGIIFSCGGIAFELAASLFFASLILMLPWVSDILYNRGVQLDSYIHTSIGLPNCLGVSLAMIHR